MVAQPSALTGWLDRSIFNTERKISLLYGESKHRVWLVTGKAGDRLPHLFCGKPAPLAENEMLHRVTACEALCAALQDGEGSNAYAHVTTAAQKRRRMAQATFSCLFEAIHLVRWGVYYPWRYKANEG